MNGPQAHLLRDGKRLHLHHGPIDLIVEASGPHREPCYATATACFQTILTGLVAELPELRRPYQRPFSDPVARRMANAVTPYHDVFVTPMAAVAGSVADEVLSAMVQQHAPPKAYVNNGGDIALHLTGNHSFSVLSPAGPITLTAKDQAKGIATSGWRGRSHSLGIADAVTVIAKTAAAADVAATLIANATDLPGHPAITRQPANDLSPDSDLGNRQVTTEVGPLTANDIKQALFNGATYAQRLCQQGLIQQAVLTVQGQTETVQPAAKNPQGVPVHA